MKMKTWEKLHGFSIGDNNMHVWYNPEAVIKKYKFVFNNKIIVYFDTEEKSLLYYDGFYCGFKMGKDK
jgi:hypothetical protein